MIIVQFSTGGGSAEVAKIAVDRHGRDQVLLLTANTLVEDSDNWRYGREVHAYIGKPRWIVLTDGRTPMEAGRSEGVIPSNRIPVCSRELKQKICRKFIETRWDVDHDEIWIGLDRDEDTRVDGILAGWAPWKVHFPLREEFYDKADILAAWEARGIRRPRLYEEGFSHANCGGACVRGGQKQWARVLAKRPDVYRYWEEEEEKSRCQVGDYSILRDRRGGTTKPLPLRKFRLQLEGNPDDYERDEEVCGCGAFDSIMPVEITGRKVK